MALTKDLARLKELDIATWKRVVRGMPLQPCGQYVAYDGGEVTAHQYKEAYILFEQMLPEVAMAWLQHCLQEAIVARRDGRTHWSYSQFGEDGHYAAIIHRIIGEYPTEERRRHYGKADAPAAALLAAYLNAIG